MAAHQWIQLVLLQKIDRVPFVLLEKMRMAYREVRREQRNVGFHPIAEPPVRNLDGLYAAFAQVQSCREPHVSAALLRRPRPRPFLDSHDAGSCDALPHEHLLLCVAVPHRDALLRWLADDLLSLQLQQCLLKKGHLNGTDNGGANMLEMQSKACKESAVK